MLLVMMAHLIVNVPTVGRIPGGATVEQLIETDFLTTDNLILNLHQGDFSITNQVAEAVNDVFGAGVAIALDSRSVKCAHQLILPKKYPLFPC